MGSIPVRVTKNNQSTKGGLIIFAYRPRESKGAVVNDMPVACQSRAPARPQARIPVRVTKNNQSTKGGLIIFAYFPRESKGSAFHLYPAGRAKRKAATVRTHVDSAGGINICNNRCPTVHAGRSQPPIAGHVRLYA